MDSSTPQAKGRPLLLGHRGCRGAFPENSVAAFDHALAAGCDGFEFDVRLTADAMAAIWHDEHISRTAISKSTYKQLLELCANPRRGLLRRSKAIGLCSLEQVLQRYGQRAFLNIELKIAGAEQLTIDLCRRFGARDVVVSSFLPEVVERLHSLAPGMAVGFIFDKREGLRRWRELPTTHVMPHRRLITEEMIREMHSAGRKVIAWTVNEEKRMTELAGWGIDGLISDDPVLLSNRFSGKGAT